MAQIHLGTLGWSVHSCVCKLAIHVLIIIQTQHAPKMMSKVLPRAEAAGRPSAGPEVVKYVG